MNFVALRMLTGDRAKYFGLVFAIAFCTFLLENQTTIFANIMKRTASQILDATDAEVWVMDPQTEYWERTKALKDTDLTRVRGSEHGGRITLDDVRAYIQQLQKFASGAPAPAAKPVVERVDFSQWGPITKKPLSSLRARSRSHRSRSRPARLSPR